MQYVIVSVSTTLPVLTQSYLYAENIKTLLFHRYSVIKSGVGCMLTDEELHIILDYFCTGCE